MILPITKNEQTHFQPVKVANPEVEKDYPHL